MNKYLFAVNEKRRQHPEWRQGQAYFNVLYDMYPDLANEVRGTKIDPFYRDERVVEFLNWVDGQLAKSLCN